MSGGVVRTSNTRRHTRNNNASPYARPLAKKSSGWGITSFLNYLNPFTSSGSEQDRGGSPPPEGEAASRLAARGQEIQTEGAARRDSGHSVFSTEQQQRPPQQPQPFAQPISQSPPPLAMNGNRRPISPRSDHSNSPSVDNVKKVREFLNSKKGESLSDVEVAGLVHLLQNRVEDDEEPLEPFRFTKSPSLTPMRGMTPQFNAPFPTASEQMASAAGSTAQSARKTLAKNPMGVYRLNGVGSARPRNRYQSPNFGSKPARTTIKIEPEKPKADTKRRRVGAEATTSSPQRAGVTAAPKVNGTTSSISGSTSPPVSLNGSVSVNGTTVNGRANGAPSPSTPTRPGIRTNGIKPTAPAIPSPLRQTWSQSDSPPQPSPPQGKPTRAACFMTELIKEVTPPKKPDFVNPYEAANPMIKPAPKKQLVRKTRAAAKVEEPKKKELELTPQAIIEATVPKGSKRSRPPPELIGVKPSEKRVTSPESSAPRRSTRLNGSQRAPAANAINGTSKTATVEQVSDEEQPSPPKKQRIVELPPPAPSKAATATVDKVDDVEMSAPPPRSAQQPSYTLPSEIIEPGDDKADKKRATSPTATFQLFGAASRAAKSSAPKAPSKLRFSIQPEREEKVEVPVPTPAITSSFAPAPAAARTVPSFQAKPAPAPVVSHKPKDARAYVAAMQPDELPTYAFTLPLSSPGAGPSTQNAREAAKVTPVPSLPTYDLTKAPKPVPAPKPTGGFDWSAAGMKAPAKPAGESWTCSVCMLTNTTSGDKCTVCEAPRPGQPKPSATQGFDWGAAGTKPPPKPAGGQWTCSTCMLQNPSDAAKCTVCDTPR